MKPMNLFSKKSNIPVPDVGVDTLAIDRGVSMYTQKRVAIFDYDNHVI